MPDPFEIFRWIAVVLYEVVKEPSLLVEFVRTFAVSLAFLVPTLSAMGLFRLYAKRHGREFPDNVLALADSREPFREARLNEPFELIRRCRPVVAALLFGGAVVAGIGFDSEPAFSGLIVLGCFSIVSKRMYVEACIAFGAEPTPAPERVDTPAPIPGT